MAQEWRVIQRTRGSTLKQLWVRLRSGIWTPTERFMTDAQMMPPILGGSPGVVDKQVAASGNDGHRYAATGFSNSQGTALIGNGWGDSYHIFARWTGITYEGNVDISYIKCYAYEDATGTPLLKIYGVDEDNPNAPTTYQEFDADPLTTAGVDWDDLWTSGTWNQSPSCNSWLQELADSHGPFTNTAIMAQVRDDGSASTNYNVVTFYDYSNHKYGPKLHIEYSVGPTPGYYKLAYASEPPTPNAWNQLEREAGTGDYKKLLFEGE